MPFGSYGLVIALAIVVSTGSAAPQRGGPAELSCRPVANPAMVPELPEASGLAVSRLDARVLWAHNDSGKPLVFALSADGAIKGRVRLAAAQVDDWEDIASGPCPQGSCLYVADIGDNRAVRGRITVYRVPEPAPSDQVSRRADAFHATYPDGPHDAEAIFVSPSSDLFVITKDIPATLYRFPGGLRPDSSVRLQRLASFGTTLDKQRVTGAALSPDGRWVVVRTHQRVMFYEAPALIGGRLREVGRVDVRPLNEPQGEAVALASDGTLYLAGEGGVRGGTFARLACTLPR